MASTRIVLPVALGSYAFLFTARPPKDGKGDPKFSLSLLIEKSREAELKPLRDLILKVAVEKFGPKAADIFGKNTLRLKQPIHDGDVERPEDESYAGKFYMTATTTRAPGIVDAKLQPVFEEGEAYSGCFFRASVAVYAFENESKGVTIFLNNVQVVKKGPRIDGRVSAEREFAEFTDEAPAAKPAAGKGKPAPKVEDDISDIE